MDLEWQKFTHLQYPTEPCSCDRSIGAPSRARDQSACCVPFVSFKKGCCLITSFASESRGMMVDRSSTPRPRHWEKLEGRKRRRRDQDRKEWVRHTGSVVQVVTGAVAGGRLARTLRRDARRRSISRPPFSSSSSPSDPPSLCPRHATNSLPGDKPPFQLATPTCDRHYC